MDNTWEMRSFGSLAEVLDEVNQRGLTGDRFKVVAEPSPAGRGQFHLLYTTTTAPDPLVASAAAAADTRTTARERAEEREDAVDEAEAIIRESEQRQK